MRRLIFLILMFSSVCSLAHSRGKKSSNDADLQAQLETTPTPKDGDVCFSPEEHCDAKLIKFVDSAKSSIDIAIYDINHEQLVHHLLMQSKKMQVRLVVDKRQSGERNSLVGLLVKAGASIRYGHQRGIMHNKFMVLDGKMVETGSYNFTNHATIANNENQIYLSSPQIVKRYHDRFEQIWKDAKPIVSERRLSSQ